MNTPTPIDPAIAVTKFVLAFTDGMPTPQWKREHNIASSRLRLLEMDRDKWIRGTGRESSSS